MRAGPFRWHVGGDVPLLVLLGGADAGVMDPGGGEGEHVDVVDALLRRMDCLVLAHRVRALGPRVGVPAVGVGEEERLVTRRAMEVRLRREAG